MNIVNKKRSELAASDGETFASTGLDSIRGGRGLPDRNTQRWYTPRHVIVSLCGGKKVYVMARTPSQPCTAR
ncbi:peroxisomal membrane protein pex31 [Moniliophthora roreri]|nr:peroxisomal membrane protein pex31 [Moniliophthora roreri]